MKKLQKIGRHLLTLEVISTLGFRRGRQRERGTSGRCLPSPANPCSARGLGKTPARGWDGLWAKRTHSMPCKAPSDMRLFRRLCPMLDRYHPYCCLLDTVEE